MGRKYRRRGKCLMSRAYVNFILCVGKDNNNVKKITEATKITPAYLIKIRIDLEKLGIVKTKVKGRRKIVSFTEEGKKVHDCVLFIAKAYGIEPNERGYVLF